MDVNTVFLFSNVDFGTYVNHLKNNGSIFKLIPFMSIDIKGICVDLLSDAICTITKRVKRTSRLITKYNSK